MRSQYIKLATGEGSMIKFKYFSIPKYTMITTIKIQKKTKKRLDKLRQYKNESYDEVIQKTLSIIDDLEDKPQLSQETLKQIEISRQQYKEGKYYTVEEIKKRFGMD